MNTVKFNNVNFSYDNGKNVIQDISFQVCQNQSIALVGKTGSGKTSLVNLLCRFYDIDGGTIEINGKNYEEYSNTFWLQE